MKNKHKNILLLLGSVVFSLIIVELSLWAYYSVQPKTTGICLGRICKFWFNENWMINSLGFRDKEWDFSESTKGALFIGDSFTAGFGVKENERFSNIANSRNHSGIHIYNAGKNNTNTVDQYKIIKMLTTKEVSLRFVVYQYLGNDIEYLLNLDWAEKPSIIQKTALFFIKNSFLFDQFLRPFYLSKFNKTYYKTLVTGYKNPETFSKHQKNIIKIFKYIRKINAKNIFIVFPMLGSKDLFNQTDLLYVKQLKQLFMDNCFSGDSLINISSLLKSLPPKKWVASKFDSHPSSEVHELIGNVIVDAFAEKKNKFLQPCTNKF